MDYKEIKNVVDLVKKGDLVEFVTDTEDEKLNLFLAGNGFKEYKITDIDTKNELIKIENYNEFIDINCPELVVVKLQNIINSLETLKADRYIYESVKDLAYSLVNKIDTSNNEFFISYKLIKRKVWEQTIYKHRIAFEFDNVWILIDLVWEGQALVINNYYIIPDIDNLEMEDIEVALPDTEEE